MKIVQRFFIIAVSLSTFVDVSLGLTVPSSLRKDMAFKPSRSTYHLSAIATNTESIKAKAGRGKSCSISGRLFGSGIQSDRSYLVVPSDPDSDEPLSRMGRVNSSNASYRLSPLPAGRYVLRVFRSESGSLLPVRTFPRQREINCTGSSITNVDFELE